MSSSSSAIGGLHELGVDERRSLNPTCTGTSVMALAFEGGVALLTDRLVAYGKSARYRNVTRQYRVNEQTLIAFSGDHADFQWLQNVIERRQLELRAMNAELSAPSLHGYLTSLLYFRRTKMNPLWNTLVVTGVQNDDEGIIKPFIGVITQRGVAYTTEHVATDMGAWLLNQVLETEARGKKLTRELAVQVLRKALELTIYHDCVTDGDFEIGIVDKDGVHLGQPETLTGNWDIAEYNCDYE